MSINLFIHLGNSPEVLAKVLAENLRTTAPDDPMEAIRIGIGQRGMARMVEHTIAHTHGISTNVQTIFPTNILYEAGDALRNGGHFNTDRFRNIVWTPDLLQWAVYAELQAQRIADPAPGTQDIYDPLRTWLQRAQGGSNVPSRRVLMQLAQQLGRVFDAYNGDRPEWHEAWVFDLHNPQQQLFSGAAPVYLPDELAWQKPLWFAVHRRLEQSTRSPIDLLHDILKAEEPAKAVFRQNLPALHLFGMVHIHRLHSAFIETLSQIVPVHIYAPSPTSAWWQDAKIQTAGQEGVSPLLTKFGQHTKFLHDNLVELAGTTHTSAHFSDHYVTPEADHALAHLQRAILVPTPETLSPYVSHDDDHSLSFHASHGALRQVEVLHDAILACIERDPTLEPSDFVVLCPQLPRFAPLIEAVFGTSHPKIPYRIEDRSLESANAVAQALQKLLDIADGRSTAPQLLELLSLQPVRQRFDIMEDDLPVVSAWLQRLDVRWGWNDETRTETGRPGLSTGTWEHALRRLALGVLLGPDAHGEAIYLHDHVAFDAVANSEQELAGNFTRFVREVFSLLDALDTSHTLQQWCDVLIGDLENPKAGEAGGLIGRLIEVSGNQSFLLEQVINKVRALQEHASATDILDEELDAAAFRAWLQGTLASDATVRLTGQGATSFAQLNASRFAGARVIFLLGMDDGSFPRPAQLPSWDIRQMNPRPNDHSDRNEDLYAILQALTLASDHFGIIWESLSPSTSQPMPPALPVLELQRLIEEHVQDGEAFVASRTIQHRMHPFSIENFASAASGARNRPFTYQQQWAQAALYGATHRAKNPNAVLVQQGYRRDAAPFQGEVSAQRLAVRLSDPQRTFLREAAQINVEPYETQLERDDPGAPTGLEKLHVYRALFALARRSIEQTGHFDLQELPEELRMRFRAEASTRPGLLGDATVRATLTIQHEAALKKALNHARPSAPHVRRVRLGDTTLFSRSSLSWHTDEGDMFDLFVLHRKLHYDALLEPVIQLCIQAAATEKAARLMLFLFHDQTGFYELSVEPEQAKSWLAALVKLHTEMWLTPLALTRRAVRQLKSETDKALQDIERLVSQPTAGSTSSSDEDNAREEKSLASFYSALNRVWQSSVSQGGPSEWELAVFGQQRVWRPLRDTAADSYDHHFVEQLQTLYELPIQLLDQALRAAKAMNAEGDA